MIRIKNYINQSNNWIRRDDNFYFITYNTEFGNFLKKLQKNSVILDVGCGQGYFLQMLEKKFKDFKTFGVEIDKNTYKIAKIKLKKSFIYNNNIFIFLKKYKNFFDAIFMIDVLKHIDSKKIPLLLNLINKSLKKCYI